LSASPEATLSLSFSPRSSGKLNPNKRRSRKRSNKKKVDKANGSADSKLPLSPKAMAAASGAAGGQRRSTSSGASQRPLLSGVRYVLPDSMREKAEGGMLDVTDWTRVHELLKKASRVEYKAILKSTRLPRTWAEKLQLFPAATSYFAYSKNRYRDVLADEHTRVKLVGMENDYINANHISGSNLPGRPKAHYIACQAPLPTTFEDFWWMVWQEKSSVVVMLTKFREKGTIKAHPYWPKEVDEVMDFGCMRVALVTQKSLPGICISTLRLTKNAPNESGGTRIVYHLFFTEWPDFGVPKSTRSIRNLLTYTNLYMDLGATQGTTGPLVLHCSAGIGRTGSFLAIHAGLLLIEANVTADVAGIVTEMRRCRNGMVQTEQQYMFVFEALNDHVQQHQEMKKPQRVISASSLLENISGTSKLCYARGRGRSVSVSLTQTDDLMPMDQSADEEEPVDTADDVYKANDNNA
jgi:protein tyrosine phosphatase